MSNHGSQNRYNPLFLLPPLSSGHFSGSLSTYNSYISVWGNSCRHVLIFYLWNKFCYHIVILTHICPYTCVFARNLEQKLDRSGPQQYDLKTAPKSVSGYMFWRKSDHVNSSFAFGLLCFEVAQGSSVERPN